MDYKNIDCRQASIAIAASFTAIYLVTKIASYCYGNDDKFDIVLDNLPELGSSSSATTTG